MKKIISYIYLLIGLLIIDSCIEPVEFSTISVDSNLVVNGILTNELKNHTVELSRTIPIDSTKLSPEKNATVFVTDNTGAIYNFQETEDGTYTSINTFSAEAAKKYTLNIETSNGQKYTSSEEMLPGTATVGDLDISIEENEISQIQELVIKANSNPSSGDGNYYRYEYDETYKIKTPIWSQKKLLIISDTNPYEFELVDKTPEEDGIGFCYGNQKSKKVLVTETLSLSQDQVIGFPIRQIPLDSYIIGIRYSILVKQYVINQNTFDFYTLLDKFSNPDDIFSQTQVGNIPSNVTSVDNPQEDKVLGFFEVSSLSTKRIFLNREDITEVDFENYQNLGSCAERVNPEIEDSRGRSPLLNRLRTGWIYQSPPDVLIIPPNKPYQLALKICGDCSHLGPVNPPDFWTE
ncbi:uncharacterized protein DUF4249 [Tenacibaculum skagerrakense]|uniref:Uncharacterized protein DUF4249 n=1 Tax=Tenacibaculum skagerrakense TaxID=186571 RepID=A0A4R2NSZ7_9FLAO|nr:DUF4249 domain-containing protein [Tenacibaculum skagerrakense]TCP24604.1 uncharacterized protein DUF4249 [Tenacibaculum skagerrakense]